MKLKENFSKIIPVFAIIIVIVFALSEIYGLASRTFVTQITYEQTVMETVDAQMYVIKDEIILNNNSSGVIVPVAKNSERVSRGSAIAAVFSNESSAENYSNLQNLNEKLESYRKINNSLRLADVDLDKLSSEIDSVFRDILNSAYRNDFSSLSENKMSFSEKLSRKQISLNKNVDVSAHIAEVQSEIAAIQSDATPTKIISADTAGYYVSHLDGYENVLTTQDIDGLTLEKFNEAVNAHPASISEGTIGKIIDGYNWYTACIVNSAEISSFDVGDSIKLVFDDYGDDTVKTVVHSVKSVDNGRSLVIFRCNLMNELLSGLRLVNGKIVIKEHTGLKVNKDAVRINEEGQEGVFVRRGELITFRRLNIIYSEESFIIATPPVITEEDKKDGNEDLLKDKESLIKNHIKLYDEVIVSGKELSDGMVI
ncbi:MAG: hypothetical protein IJB45_02915 [Clostridia bacterium]|nr:hypothetical protein [Clostridia bacterium]